MLVGFKVFVGGLEIAVNSVVRRACSQTLDAVFWQYVEREQSSAEHQKMRQQKVSVWDHVTHGRLFKEVCLELVVYVKYNYVVFMITKYC